MSCNCNSYPAASNCSPCPTCEELNAQNEPLQSALDNFIKTFYGTVTKTVVNGKVQWTLPCSLDVGFPNNPRKTGEGLACYFLRLFQEGIVGLTGPRGETGPQGDDGGSTFTTLAANFVQPAADCTTVGMVFTDTSLFSEGAYVRLVGSGYYKVTAVSGTTVYLSIVELSATAAGSVIPTGSIVYVTGPIGEGTTGADGPAGPAGPTGPTGPAGAIGPSAQTVVTTAFTMPTLYGNTVALNLLDASAVDIGQSVHIKDTGYLRVVSVIAGAVVLKNLYPVPTNVAPGTAIPAGKTLSITGGEGLPAYTYTTAAFNQPAVGANATVEVSQTGFLQVGDYVRVNTAGLMQVAAVVDYDTLTLSNTGYSGNAAPGVAVPSSSHVTISGPPASIFRSITEVNADVTLSPNTYDFVNVDASGALVTVSLPAAAGSEGHAFHIKKIDASAFTVVIDADGAELIDGAGTATITTQYESVSLVSDGSNWFIF